MGRILTVLQDEGLLARHEIADRTGLTRATVSKAVAALMGKGVVSEVERGRASSRGGPRPIMLKLDEQALNFVGFDIRRERITAAVTSLGGELQHVEKYDIPPDTSTEDFVATIERSIAALQQRCTTPLAAVGIGSIGPVDAHAGIIRSSYFDRLSYLPVVERLQAKFSLPVALRVGSAMGAYGEERIAARQATKVPKSVAFVMIDYGGIGLGLISGGSAWLTDHGGVGELGHVTIDANGRPCSCGRRGCLVEYASGRVLVEELDYADRRGGAEHLWLSRVAGDAQAGNAHVRESIATAGEYLGCGIADIDRLLRPERIVLASSHDHLAEWYMVGVRRHLQSLPDGGAGPKLLERLRLAETGSAAVAYGAAAMQLKHFIRSPSRILGMLDDVPVPETPAFVHATGKGEGLPI